MIEQKDVLDVLVLAERIHRQFLDVIQLQLDNLAIRDINSIRAMILLNVGDAEMTASELLSRGCYLGSNVSYNLKKLTETGYVIQTRSAHDRRVIMVRLSSKGSELCQRLQGINQEHIVAMTKAGLALEDLTACRKTLRGMQQFWSRIRDTNPVLAGGAAPVFAFTRSDVATAVAA